MGEEEDRRKCQARKRASLSGSLACLGWKNFALTENPTLPSSFSAKYFDSWPASSKSGGF